MEIQPKNHKKISLLGKILDQKVELLHYVSPTKHLNTENVAYRISSIL